ncbi:multicopper oxidase family protein [Streptomyces sp. NPDC002446]
MRTHSRRAVLGAGLAAAGSGLLAPRSLASSAPDTWYGGGAPDDSPGARRDNRPPAGYVSPFGPEVAEAENERGRGPVRYFSLTATETELDLGGVTVKTWAYGHRLPGRLIRVTAGERIALHLRNRLPQPTTIHWHGLQLRNDMDGVPGVTQRAVKTGDSFNYLFTASTPGTHWIHPHVGVQLDRGLYAPLIVDDPDEPLSYDKEWIVVIDDWLDGVDGVTPDAVLAELNKDKPGGPMGHGELQMEHRGGRRAEAAASRMVRGAMGRMDDDDGDDFSGTVEHPYHLMNGKTRDDRETFRAKPGDRIRIRFINASGDTAYRVALGDHMMTVTHTDGFAVAHQKTDSLLIGMAERYDVLVTAKDGVFPLTALSAGKNNQTAQALLRTGSGEAPDPKIRPKELRSGGLSADKLKADESCLLDDREPDRTIRMNLTGTMEKWNWAINGKPYTPSQRYPVEQGERVRIVFRNKTKMWHPMHLHGHTFALPDGGPRKDTTIMLPGKKVAVEFDADNPGLWMTHCHNIYHSESGMMTVLGYRLPK